MNEGNTIKVNAIFVCCDYRTDRKPVAGDWQIFLLRNATDAEVLIYSSRSQWSLRGSPHLQTDWEEHFGMRGPNFYNSPSRHSNGVETRLELPILINSISISSSNSRWCMRWDEYRRQLRRQIREVDATLVFLFLLRELDNNRNHCAQFFDRDQRLNG